MGNGTVRAGTMLAVAILVLSFLVTSSGCAARQEAAKVEEPKPTDPLIRIAALQQERPSFNIDIWTDKKRYRVGEEIRFYFRANRDCYLTLIDYETNGTVKVL